MNSFRNNEPEAKRSSVDGMEDFRLGAARRRLAESTGQTDAIEALREIAGNFLGSEEIGLFEIDRKTGDIQLLWCFGIDPKQCHLLGALGDVGLQRMLVGKCHVAFVADDGAGSEPRTEAFVPIRLADHTVAILAILRLLPQKQGFDRQDMDLLALLSDEAGKALFGSTLNPVTNQPKART